MIGGLGDLPNSSGYRVSLDFKLDFEPRALLIATSLCLIIKFLVLVVTILTIVESFTLIH